jgi:Domain of unknown function (DUF5666)
MKRLIALVGAFTFAGTLAFAHGGNEHVRGVVTNVSGQSVTVQTAGKATKTLTLTDKTTFKQAGKAAQLSDLHVGDRVVIDVREKTTTALLIQIGAAPKTDAHK